MQIFSAWTFPGGRESMMGLSIVEPNPGSIDNHRIGVSGVSRIFEGTWIGVLGTLQRTPSDGNLDLGLGGYHRINSRLRFGWTAQNLTEALDTLGCNRCDERLFGIGSAWFFDRKERFSFFVDAQMRSFSKNGWLATEPALGFTAAFGDNRNLQVIASAQGADVFSDPQARVAAGIVFQQYFYSTLVSLRYSLTEFPVLGFEPQTPTHSISLGLVWDAFADRTNPRPFVRVTHPLISPDATDSLPRAADFMLRIDDESGKLGDWSLVIYTARKDLSPGQLVRRFQGKGQPPTSIHWQADDVSNNPCAMGIYAYRLIVKDAAGNQAWTDWQHLEIR
jgi:hypothetical protein